MSIEISLELTNRKIIEKFLSVRCKKNGDMHKGIKNDKIVLSHRSHEKMYLYFFVETPIMSKFTENYVDRYRRIYRYIDMLFGR